MDVTSLLNGNSNAVDQQKSYATRLPTRSRTPWDAGGYSLPINTASSQPITPPYTRNDEIPTYTPTSPRHKFSDSRSSLSSFTSSLQSATHSRYSSMSTVCSTQPINSIVDKSSPKFVPEVHIPDSDSIRDLTPPRSTRSPVNALERLPSIEAQPSRHNSLPSIHYVESALMSNAEKQSSPSLICSVPEERPGSPSDAMLIRRPTIPSLRLDTEDLDLIGSESHQNRTFLSAPWESHKDSSLHSRGHKRALSAPDFRAVVTNVEMTKNKKATAPRVQPTPPRFEQPHNPSPIAMTSSAAPPTPPFTSATSPSHSSIVCLYIPDCETGSAPRKAISHIFGRNKMCTRQIPEEVWVHYCRKHYQRSRYRNPKEYAKLQCDLVQQQIRRIHDWSTENRMNGRNGVVRDWSISIRKREQQRLDNKNRKRSAAALDDEEEAEGESVPATAVPQWLLDMCGNGYSTREVVDIFNRLHAEILQDVLSCFPDIELLPNMDSDDEVASPLKGHARKTSSCGGNGHKRAKSAGFPWASSHASSSRRPDQPNPITSANVTFSPSTQKRRREMNENTAASMHHARLSHRPAFETVHEHESTSGYFHPPSEYRSPMVAPTPQRSMSILLEYKNDVDRSARPRHQRSRSDMGTMGHGFAGPSSISAYSQLADHRQLRDTQFAEHGPQSTEPSRVSVETPRFARDRATPSHHRNQSTPMLSHSLLFPSSLGSRISVSREHSPHGTHEASASGIRVAEEHEAWSRQFPARR